MYNVDLMKNVFFMHNRFDLYVNILLTEKWLSTQSSEVTQSDWISLKINLTEYWFYFSECV